jgi:aerobic-type carbon monoxide dehydrogenase small subunit (CoxS/CutS family)
MILGMDSGGWMRLALVVNDEAVELETTIGEMALVDLLRDVLGLTGTKRGCESGTCGACSVLVDGRPTRSCRVTVKEVAGRHVTTIEGLSGSDGGLSDLQSSLLDHGAVQCGYCTPAMVVTAEALLRRNPSPSRAEIRSAINSILCRCTGYQQIVDAIEATAAARRNVADDDSGVLTGASGGSQ